MKVRAAENPSVNKPRRSVKVRIGYKRYSNYSKIYCLDSQTSLFTVQAHGKYRTRFTMPQYNYSEIMLFNLETALENVESGGGKVLLEEIEL
ncbi:MAG TPA: hypothetical protein VFD60_09110 [Nitrososphaeraceae archaeon]|jgi:hypothetical protein|nr:hypothetical protein [Nitrososphaeraceae archaeon]